MTIALSSTVTGSAQAGLTSPTYGTITDQAPDVNAKQYAVTSLGGTQNNVRTHAASDPFTVSFWREKVLKVLPALGLNGRYNNVPMNVYKVITRKGVRIAADNPAQVMIVHTEIRVPAGGESYDHANIKAALSAHIGSLTDTSSGLGDSTYTGTL